MGSSAAGLAGQHDPADGPAGDPAADAGLPPRDGGAGWVVVVAAMIGLGLGLSPMPFYTIGMFAPELQKAFGWSFAALMGSITVQSLVVMATGPLAGLAVDRYGARPVALVSTVLFGLCFIFPEVRSCAACCLCVLCDVVHCWIVLTWPKVARCLRRRLCRHRQPMRRRPTSPMTNA